ncbi:unnamed protein product [Trichobilharzia szidati]|nr:unnamed protein product [Trichobilharzia szidati]
MSPNKQEVSKTTAVSSTGYEVTRSFRNLGEPVYVNVYHLHWPNGLKMGAYHTGTVVYDREFGFGGHPFASSGIFQTTPMDIDNLGEEISFKERLYMGRTYLSKKAVERLLVSLADEFRGDAYHLLHFNCNHFTSQFVDLLCHGTLPKWVNRLARIVSGLPFIESFLPPHWVRPSLMYDCDYDEEDFREEEEEEDDDDEEVKTLSEDEKEEKKEEEPKVDTEKNNRNLVIINETPTTTTTTTATKATDKMKNTTSTSNSTTHYKKADDQNVQCPNDSLMKTFTEKPHFQFVYSASTGNGHVPHHNNSNNNKHSIDHSDNHHNTSLCNIRMV